MGVTTNRMLVSIEEKLCPECGKEVREIGKEIYFCKECDEIFTEPSL